MSDYLHALFGALPAIAWVGLLAAAILGGCIPWLVEAKLPEGLHTAWAVLAVYGAAIAVGPPAAHSLWHDSAAYTLGLIGSVGVQVARDVAAKRWPWLSPRQQIVVRRNEQGQVVAIKEGDDPTIFIKPGDKP